MKQVTMSEYLKTRYGSFPHCGSCVCPKCLYWWSGRCPEGECYDDKRAKEDPYDKAFPQRSPRTQWSNWNLPGEQAHWCRGGNFYPVSYCERFVKYQGSEIEDCIRAPVQYFQDGYLKCTLKDRFGLVNVILDIKGEKYIIYDIFLRMLKPEELKQMQGFPKDYIISRDYNWKSYPVAKQVARIGNSVVPMMAQKLVEANCPYLKVGERVPSLNIDDSQGQLRFA